MSGLVFTASGGVSRVEWPDQGSSHELLRGPFAFLRFGTTQSGGLKNNGRKAEGVHLLAHWVTYDSPIHACLNGGGWANWFPLGGPLKFAAMFGGSSPLFLRKPLGWRTGRAKLCEVLKVQRRGNALNSKACVCVCGHVRVRVSVCVSPLCG